MMQSAAACSAALLVLLYNKHPQQSGCRIMASRIPVRHPYTIFKGAPASERYKWCSLLQPAQLMLSTRQAAPLCKVKGLPSDGHYRWCNLLQPAQPLHLQISISGGAICCSLLNQYCLEADACTSSRVCMRHPHAESKPHLLIGIANGAICRSLLNCPADLERLILVYR